MFYNYLVKVTLEIMQKGFTNVYHSVSIGIQPNTNLFIRRHDY